MTLGKELQVGLLRLMKRSQRRAALAAVASKAPPQDPTLVIARVIGNDLWPRHSLGQSLQNLEFILQREPAFPRTRKLFVLTRIVDAEALARAEAMVREAGHETLILPFDPAAYAAERIDTSTFGGDDYFLTEDFAQKPFYWQGADRLWAAAGKIRQVMDVNGGRNAALDWGQSRADWTLVLDGSCFVTEKTFRLLHADLIARPFVPYVVLPMQRLPHNEDAFSVQPDPASAEEPQLCFSARAKGRFEMAFPYGFRDKTSLLGQIGIPGEWEIRGNLPWLPTLPVLPDTNCWKRTNTAVFRLSSGIAGGALERADAARKRHESRNQAIFLTLAALDDRFGSVDLARTRIILGLQENAA